MIKNSKLKIKNSKRIALTGNEAMALAMKQTLPDVFVAYPITPTSDIISVFSKFVADGEVETEFEAPESEHSVASILFGSSSAGARSFTCTSSQGLELMHEILHIIAGARLPVVIASGSRALSSPINVHGDQSDFMGLRGTSLIQIYSENAQECYDNFIQAVRIAESVRLPAIVSADGFYTSHNLESVETLSDNQVSKFVGKYSPEYNILNTKSPITIGPLALPDSYFEIKASQAKAMQDARKKIINVAQSYNKISGREYGFYREYRLSDAEIGIVVMGSTAETAQIIIDKLRKNKVKAGMLSLRVFRPFPAEEIQSALKHLKKIIVLDRSESFSAQGGPLFGEIRSALYGLDSKPDVYSRIYGLGGREMTEEMISGVFNDLQKAVKEQRTKKFGYVGLKK